MVDELVKDIKDYATINNVPIILDASMDFLTDLILKNNVKNILEIGTAIGYSAIKMALINKDIKITTIEKEKDRYLLAVKNVKKVGLEDQITLVYNDAMEVKLKDKFDLIFIDAAKSKNEEFFKKFEGNLNSKGIIVTDNLSFHGYVNKDISEIESKNIRGLVKKIKNYIGFLGTNRKYKTNFYDIGDGLSVSEKRN